ncbi:MAG: peptidoglycan-binding protein [Rhodobacterales bacterium 32-67-9]|nr:MAG: peptidoglycan-binding protein [Rhodobacterales bacterium 32-67-9]
MRLAAFLFGLALWLGLSGGVLAQSQVWVQIEAQPSLREAEERARAYAGVFPNVGGFAMNTGWYAIVLGPYPPAEADRQLQVLKGERLIPGDSYIAFGNQFERQFWPVGAAAVPTPAAPVDEVATALPAPDPVPAPVPLDETPAEARRSEALLSAADRQMLQQALQWDGFYAGAIDGAFGPGTRRSMAAWQAAQGYVETGILTTAQRAELVGRFESERAALGLETLTETEAGIEITYPSALVAFDRYAPPFVHFREKDGSGFRMLLISQTGDQATLAGLYDIMQTLEIVPVAGERQLNRTSFVLTGSNDRLQSYTEARLSGGAIKGFSLIWTPEGAARADKVLAAMKAGFRPLGDTALDEGLGQPLSVDQADLVSGLDVRRPVLSRSGFWLDGSGLVATTDEVLDNCARVTLDGSYEADVTLRDADRGLAILTPREPLAPRAHARLASGPARINSEIAVAGFSYEDALDNAVLSFGRLTDTKGLDGETDRTRLEVTTLAGDAGGPVLDTSGTVIGMLLPRVATDGRVLPADVGFALPAPAIAGALEAAGLAAAEPAAAVEASAPVAPQDLTTLGRDMTVLVSCWR